MTFEEFHPLLASTIAGIATEYGRKANWFGATREDFAQEMIAWLLDNEEKIGPRFTESVEEATRYTAKCLRNECKDHLASLRGQATGDTGGVQYDYGRDELKVLLDYMFEAPDADTTSLTVIESVADVEQMFSKLGAEDQSILTAFHRDDYTNKMLAELYDISEANMSYRHNRAVLRLQRLLGRSESSAPDPWVGRRAITNSAARAQTASTYGE